MGTFHNLQYIKIQIVLQLWSYKCLRSFLDILYLNAFFTTFRLPIYIHINFSVSLNRINVTISDGFTSRSGKCKFSYFDYTVKFKTCTTAYTTIIEETKSYIIYLFIFILFIDSLALDNYVVVVLFVKFVV